MKVKVGKRIATIENWTLCATSKLMNNNVALDMITMEIAENPNLKFDMIKFNERNVTSKIIMGEIYGKTNCKPGTFVKTGCILKIENGFAITNGGRRYRLGKMHPDYAMFVDFVSNNKPVLFNYVFATDFIRNNDEVYVSANIYINGDVSYISGRVEKQDFEKHTITIDGTEYFVNWMSMNECLRKRFNPMANTHVLNRIPINVDVENETFAGDNIFGKEIDLFGSEWDIDLLNNYELFEAPKSLKFK